MADDRARSPVDRPRDLFDATTTASRGLGQRLLARWDEIQIGPRPVLERLVLVLRDAGFVRRPLLETRSLGSRDAKCVREEDSALDAPPQRAGVHGRGSG